MVDISRECEKVPRTREIHNRDT